MRALVLALLVACTAARPVGPTAIVRLAAPEEWSLDDRTRIAEGLAAWRELGFETLVEVQAERELCPNNWALVGRVDCVLVIGLRKEAGLIAMFNTRGQADRAGDIVTIDADVRGAELAYVIAHEVGHILLNTGRHTTHGVMAQFNGWLRRLSSKDRALACETIKRGC